MTAGSLAGPSAASEAGRPQSPWGSLLAVCLGVFVVAIGITVTSVGNPVLAQDLGATLSQLQWVTNGYLLALASTLVLAGRIGDRFDRRKLFLLGIAGFGLTTTVITFAPTVGVVIGARALQGVFGALILTNALTLLRTTFPVERLPVALGVFTAVLEGASASGPIIGGWLIGSFGWRSGFAIGIPIAVISLVVAALVIRRQPVQRAGRFDFAGTALLVLTLVCLTYAVIQAPEAGWGSPIIVAALAASAILGTAFVLAETRVADPLVPLRLFRDRSVTIGLTLTLMTNFALLGAMFFVILHLQNVLGRSPLEAGLQTTPLSVATMVAAMGSSALIRRAGTRGPLVGAFLVAGIAFLLFTGLGADASYLDVGIPFALLGAGLGVTMTASMHAILANTPAELAAPTAGIHQMVFHLGGLVGTAVLGAVVAARSTAVWPSNLAQAGVPGEVAARIERSGGALVSQGVAPVPEGLSGQVGELVTRAAHLSFASGMHAALWVGAVTMLLCAVLGLFVGNRAAGTAS
ncbi:DHA2 family efflux MFS transporter permease subunit [Nonomuraea lactucae]|uniref:DHA2 family efflux MFS transporter permease subunit n=1 Tax=Nonomuraea lactucae TaxID=2249762 RepID=UPI0013B3AF62|nr:DHA2 family efflux MFS transporter permease subunit [Nonomuraea lactucae]